MSLLTFWFRWRKQWWRWEPRCWWWWWCWRWGHWWLEWCWWQWPSWWLEWCCRLEWCWRWGALGTQVALVTEAILVTGMVLDAWMVLEARMVLESEREPTSSTEFQPKRKKAKSDMDESINTDLCCVCFGSHDEDIDSGWSAVEDGSMRGIDDADIDNVSNRLCPLLISYSDNEFWKIET